MLGVSIQVWLSHDDTDLAPGETLTLQLTVHNLGETTESYTVVPAGFAASWTTVGQGNLTLRGGSQEVLDVIVSPPAISTTSAGPTSIAVRIIPLGFSDDAVVAESTVTVAPFDDCRLVALQSVQRARRRATYEFMVENHGNTMASCRLHLIDLSDRMDGDFDPPAVGVAPGAASLVQLRAKARRGGFRRATRILEFEVEAARQGSPPAATSLTFVQSAAIPGRAIAQLAGILALTAAVVLGWLGVVKPAIEKAARDQVDERVTEFEVQSEPGDEPLVTTSVVETDAGGEESDDQGSSGEQTTPPLSFRLPVAAPLTQVLDQTFMIPEGAVFDMTDVRVENQYGDLGIATLLVNDEQTFIWSLQNIRGSHFEPRITPIRLQPGDNVTFSVRCDEIGDASRSTCSNAVNISGTTAALPEQ